MKLILKNIILPFYADDGEFIKIAADRMRRSGVDPRTLHFQIYKRSFDARRRDDIKAVCSVLVETEQELCADEVKRLNASEVKKDALSPVKGAEKLEKRPLVVGMGPAGLFCALLLAENGYAPILIDRGAPVEERVRDVDRFYAIGELDVNSNIQFGAGGAGTFSDGKLVTRINDEKCSYVLERLHEFGAPADILTKAKPHVGTDLLRGIVSGILARIEELGGELRYRCRLSDFAAQPDGSVTAVTDSGEINCSVMVLAIGHSARDTVKMLMDRGMTVEPKPFSVGVRIEHLKETIDRGLYGDLAGHPKLGAGEYNLSDTKGGRGVYTFCMCPGGEVVAAASEYGGVVVNGMSRHARNGRNSNSALAVTVTREDYGNTVEGAIEYQRRLERAAFEAGGSNYGAPIQTVGDFMTGRAGSEPTSVLPTYINGERYKLTRLDKLLPGYITDGLRRGIALFGKRLPGFDAPDALLSGVETRTSSPVRIPRSDDMTGIGFPNIYPCGEGAGYAGGITSAAVDGIRTALEIIKKYAPVSK